MGWFIDIHKYLPVHPLNMGRIEQETPPLVPFQQKNKPSFAQFQ